MPVVRRHDVLLVPARPMFSDHADPPGVYRSMRQLAERWVYYRLGRDAELEEALRPEDGQTDAEVIASLRNPREDEPRVPTLALVNADAFRVSGFSASFPHRLLSLPRLALVPSESPPARR